jgi:hypothetical protein
VLETILVYFVSVLNAHHNKLHFDLVVHFKIVPVSFGIFFPFLIFFFEFYF